MREIKFRAWWECVKKLVYFDGPYIGEDSLGKWGIHFPVSSGPVFLGKAELEQFTGLKDNKGKDIFEGDIVKWLGYETRDGEQIRPGRWMVVGEGTVAPTKSPGDFIFDCCRLQCLIDGGCHSVKVIGNIHENPEILQDV